MADEPGVAGDSAVDTRALNPLTYGLRARRLLAAEAAAFEQVADDPCDQYNRVTPTERPILRYATVPRIDGELFGDSKVRRLMTRFVVHWVALAAGVLIGRFCPVWAS